VKYETNCADRGVMVMQALMLVVIIAQEMCKKTSAATRVQANEHYDAKTAAAEMERHTKAANDAAASGVHRATTRTKRTQTERTGTTPVAGEVTAEAETRTERTQTQRTWTGSRQTMQKTVASMDEAVSGRQAVTRGETAAIRRSTQLRCQKQAITAEVLVMMMLTTTGAAVHMGERAEAWTDREVRAEATLHILEKVNLDMCSRIHGYGPRVNLGRHQLLIRRVLNAGRRIQQEAQALRTCGPAETEMAEKAEVRIDRAGGDEETLHIMQEVNLDMRSKIKKQGKTVNLSRHIQFMSRLLDAERRNEWSTKELRQGKSAETGSIQERKSKDMGGAEEQRTVGQLTRRNIMLKRRLQDDERQREGAEKERQHTLSQVTEFMQEQLENDVL